MSITPHSMNADTSTFIGGFYKQDPILDEMIDYFESNVEFQEKGRIGKDEGPIIDPSIKDSTDLILESNPKLRNRYVNEYLQSVLDEYIKLYPKCDDLGRYTVNGRTNIQRYFPSQGYKAWHCERINPMVANRHLVWITYLNTVEDEGGTEFYHQKVKVKAEKGLTIIFPVDWTHTHRGITSPTETKYIATGWYNFV